MEKHKIQLKKLLGFRSGTPWKSIVAVLYYVLCLSVFVVCLFTPPLITAGVWDTLVVKLSLAVIFLWMLSPALFLSDTPLRGKLPFFKKNRFLDSLVGMAFVFVLFSYLFALTESFHTADYKDRFRTYTEQYSVQAVQSTGSSQMEQANIEELG